MRLSVDALAALPTAGRWGVLLVASALLAAGLEAIGAPAALLLGPMLAGVVVGVLNGRLHVPPLAFSLAQSLVGCLIAADITPGIVTSFLRDWPLFLGVVVATILASSWLGWQISRTNVLPGTTGIWGSSPGAASAMVLMASAFGADVRLVAFMQYLRVICVTLAASLVAGLWTQTGTVHVSREWFPAHTAAEWATTAALVLAGLAATRLLRFPSASFLLPMLLGGLLNSLGLVSFALPPWLLALGYVALGWSIGLGFTLQVLAVAMRALPWILASIALLIAFCGGLAAVLVYALGVDPLTAYLATSPGGLDSVAIIAAASNVDLGFVVALQTVRFVIVVLAGPPLARFTARRASSGERS
ncbi:hypothetical protein FHS82_003233 [Pseudochelatococcus lubricantis]|uniref:Ammonia monooxygenase n=1 Tax=Pseudochelatococcus lubricantis TaxID=1538102 RepID=A0ABX0V2L7_9HYPH|nr:AbrB family transcriptional regulator [Pseudochelatococcus lubricantis]NIJ59378.1 hypothetical protein [Pseudochelatococcus lubricantis]